MRQVAPGSRVLRVLEQQLVKVLSDAVAMGMTPTRAATLLRDYELAWLPRGWLDEFAATVASTPGPSREDYAAEAAAAREIGD